VEKEARGKYLLDCWNLGIFDKQTAEEVKPICISIVKRYVERKSKLYGFEELVNESIVAAWEAMKDYKMMCPKCGESFSSISAFEKHRIEHAVVRPTVSITTYIYYRAEVRLQWLLNQERLEKHYPEEAKIYSLDNASYEYSYHNFIGREDKYLRQVEVTDLIRIAVQEFEEIERKVIELALAGEESVLEIARILQPELGFSRTWIRKLAEKALEKFGRKVRLLAA